ncbi:unnamed protein product [Parnassius apollo]|uniref:(apollo) hypothetical protein n=1 Tax=Parnassius apollo TaxID=110799 RepID=A0A8S3XG46_PARAO|nr:unnamed protein product [Parnassius apollo]
MDQERKNNWRCQECSSKQPKSDNTNTPVRTTYRPMVSGDDTNVEEESNITVRTKKQRSKSDTNDSYIKEDSLRSIIKQEITDTIKQLVSEHLTNIASQVTGFHESLAFFSKKYDELMQTVKERNEVIQSLIQKNDNLSSQVRSLTERIEQIEQNMRAPNVEINGIPEHKSENLLKTIEQLGFAIENPLGDNDVLHVSRIAKLNKESDRPRSVIVKLRSQRRRDELLAAVTKFNKKNPDNKLNSEHLGIGGRRVPVYVSEHLTPKNKHLHAAARKKAKETGAKFVWVRDGRIFVRKHEQSHAIYIKHEESLKLIV